eukprot:TRINITY_DN64590_c1_g1_i1.p1 TRINITY_DN64590_c1_g1~~TRINITY_DN64590_c1_g1_i1.p1  ORF type:complete len:583 (+),score=20.08 TRINITY_DN64590_c1_g1_i1:89-1750(+)
MNSRILYVLAIICLSLSVFCEKMRNIDYLSFGYDLFRGNPLSTSGGVDPGFQIQRIFQFTYDGHQQSSDGRWDIPDHTTVVREDSCNLEFSSTAISGSESYSHSLDVFVSASFEGWGAKFKGSVDYKKVEERTQKHKELYTTSKGECKIYTGKIDEYLPPKLTDNFVAAVASLPENYVEEEYMRFIYNFGTHYVEQVHMGARFSCITRLTEKAWTSLLEKNIKVETAASFSAFGVTGALDTRTEDQKRLAKEFNSVKTEMQLSIVGSKPIKEHGPIEWAQQAIAEPMPMRYSIEKISELFTVRFFKGHTINKDLNKLKANMERALMRYCEYLVRRGVMRDCKNPSPDPPFPKVINSCRLCAESCGGAFPVTSGGYANPGAANPALYEEYSRNCALPFGRHRFNGGAYLCCQNEDNTRTGACKVCASCGDEYSEVAGTVSYSCSNDFYIPILSYDDRCHGELRVRDRHARPSVCCKKPAICSMCLSCGGEFPEETALFHPFKILFISGNLAFSGKGAQCQGHFSGNTGTAKLCCRTKGHVTNGEFIEEQRFITD